jgi:dihydroorotate dehydrogenase electron transfer subunit
MRDDVVRVLGNQALAGGHYLLSVSASAQAAKARPGQFAMLHLLGRSDVLLRRPLSIFNIQSSLDRRGAPRDKSILQFLYKKVGRGTSLLAGLKPGDEIGLLGPLGHGFFEDEYPPELQQAEEVLYVAGGIGIAALLLPARQLAQQGLGQRLFFGARTRADLVGRKEFKALVAGTVLATEDGSAGVRGFVTCPLEEYFVANPGKKIFVMACGPGPMLRATAELAHRFGHPCLVSMESRMGCGLGACLGCAIRVQGEGQDAYRCVCKDGPVFRAEKIVWDKLAD